jgi:hypothetical protein
LVLCQTCDEYIYAAERQCPHCGAATAAGGANDKKPELDVRTSIDAIERHGRRILEIAGMARG